MKKLLSACLAAMMILCCTACGGSSSSSGVPSDSSATSSGAADDTVYTLSFGCSTSEDNAIVMGAREWASYLEAESNGRIKVEIYPNGQLGNDRELVEAVQMGQLVCMATGSSNMSNFVPELQIFDIPFILNDEADFQKLLADDDFYNTLAGYFDAHGLKMLGESSMGFRNLTSNKEVHTLADMSGIKIRVMEAPVPMAMWEALGCKPTPIAFTELYTALQQGLVDAQENPLQLVYGQKFYEQQKYFVYTKHQIMGVFFVMDPNWYAALPDDLKEIVDSSVKVINNTVAELSEQIDAQQKETMEASGMQFIDVDDSERSLMREATNGIWAIVEGDYADAVAAYRDALARVGME